MRRLLQRLRGLEGALAITVGAIVGEALGGFTGALVGIAAAAVPCFLYYSWQIKRSLETERDPLLDDIMLTSTGTAQESTEALERVKRSLEG